MHSRAMVGLTLLSSAGSLALTASFAEGPSPKSVPTYKVVAGWPEPSGPIKLGQVSAVATDSSDRVFVFHRGEQPVLVFDRDGKFLRSLGDGLVEEGPRPADRPRAGTSGSPTSAITWCGSSTTRGSC